MCRFKITMEMQILIIVGNIKKRALVSHKRLVKQDIKRLSSKIEKLSVTINNYTIVEDIDKGYLTFWSNQVISYNECV